MMNSNFIRQFALFLQSDVFSLTHLKRCQTQGKLKDKRNSFMQAHYFIVCSSKYYKILRLNVFSVGKHEHLSK